jgi:hypothetical protein
MNKVSFINPEKEKKGIDEWKYQWKRATGRLDGVQDKKQRDREAQLLSQELTKQ